MPALNKKPKYTDDELAVCIESWAATDGSCAAGTRLRGNHEVVRGRPQFFAPADTPDDELERLWRALYPDGMYLRA